jgi:hypothetical protein
MRNWSREEELTDGLVIRWGRGDGVWECNGNVVRGRGSLDRVLDMVMVVVVMVMNGRGGEHLNHLQPSNGCRWLALGRSSTL